MPTLKTITDYRDYLIDPDSLIIYVQFWVAGSRYRRSTGVKATEANPPASLMKKAISEGRKIVADFDKDKGLREALSRGVVLVSDWVPKWLESLNTTWKSKEARADAKSRWTKHLSKFFYNRGDRALDVRDISEGLWLQYAQEFQRKNPGRLLKHHVAYLRHFLYYMHEQRNPETNERLLAVVPMLKDFDPARDTPGRSITEDEERSLLENCHKPEHRLQLKLGMYMGMRPGEVCTLQKKFINWETMEIDLPATFVKTGKKKRKGRQVPIHPDVAGDLRKQFDSHKFAHLFPSPKDPKKPIGRSGNRSAWARIKSDAKIEGRLRRHDMRVTRATRFAEQGVAEQLAQDVLGMSGDVLKHHYQKFSAKSRKKVYDKEGGK